MVKVKFNYNGKFTIIKCNKNNKMKDIINKYIYVKGMVNENILFIYNGNKINEKLKLIQQINQYDKKRK